MGWGLWWRLSRCGGRRAWADALCLHVGHQLVGDLGQHIPGQAGHAQHVVAGAVHVVPEGHKLGEAGKWGQDGAAGSPTRGPTAPNSHFMNFTEDSISGHSSPLSLHLRLAMSREAQRMLGKLD